MEGVDHIDVRKIGGSRLVGDVDGVGERKVPYREGLELRITRFHSPLALVVDLRKAGRHFTRAGAGCGDDYDGARGLNVLVLTEARVRNYMGDIRGIAAYCDISTACAVSLEPVPAMAGTLPSIYSIERLKSS